MIANFKNLPPKYRSIPFWSWNDQLEPELLKWQLREMERAGIGGFFMHARGGLETKYLNDEWMQCIGIAISEGKKLGLKSWIYDDEGWPSGFAGGRVAAISNRFHSRWIVAQKLSPDQTLPEAVLGIYHLDFRKGTCRKLDEANASVSGEDAESRYAVYLQSNPYYIDVMCREAVAAFIQCTHEKYYRLFGEEFGEAVQGFFTDEPRLFWNNEGDIPWSFGLEISFQQKYNEDLLEKLPLLFFELEGYQKLRFEFWQLVSELFVTNYMKQIYDWCNAHHCKLTGHVMMEENVFAQMTGTAGAMPFYEYMHIPGVDWLRRSIGNLIIPKQAGSVAAQLGKENVLTESYALCGWNVSFEELKWIAEWQYVNGVNLMCQHLESYTLRGLRKRDYPPSLFVQQPWWEEYYLFNDYLAKLNLLLSSGESVTEILMIHPMHSGWIVFNGGKNDRIKKLDADLAAAAELLSGLHLDYHLGDETIIGKYGRVQGNTFIVGKCEYRVVVLPALVGVDQTTCGLLNQFTQNGGLVVSLGDFPLVCNGIITEELAFLKLKTVNCGLNDAQLLNAIGGYLAEPVSIGDEKGEITDIHYQLRRIEGDLVLFMVNHNPVKPFRALVTLKGSRRIRKLSLEDNRIIELPYRTDGIKTCFYLDFQPMQSQMISIEESNEKAPNIDNQSEQEIVLTDDWMVEKADLNALTLDYCQYSLDEGPWQGPIPIIKLMDRLLEMRCACDIALKFNFVIEADLHQNKEFYLVVEKTEEYEIKINGKKFDQGPCGSWIDSSFLKTDIREYLSEGANEIVLKRRFFQSPQVYQVLYGENVYESEKNKLTYDVELESIYLVGDFGVISRTGYSEGERNALYTEGPFVIVDLPREVKAGDLTAQGFCFFAGNIELGQTFNWNQTENVRTFLRFDQLYDTLTKVIINGREAKNILWRPYEVDLTDFLLEGTNRLTLKLYGSNRNLLGPHHHIRGELYNVGPMSFTGKWSWVERETEDVVFTEADRQRNYWVDRYCFTKFGLGENETK